MHTTTKKSYEVRIAEHDLGYFFSVLNSFAAFEQIKHSKSKLPCSMRIVHIQRCIDVGATV